MNIKPSKSEEAFNIAVELIRWRNAEYRRGNIEKAQRIQRVLERRNQQFGIGLPLPTICGC